MELAPQNYKLDKGTTARKLRKYKGAPKLFFNHVSAIGASTKYSEMLLRNEQGKIFDAEGGLRYVRIVVRYYLGAINERQAKRTSRGYS